MLPTHGGDTAAFRLHYGRAPLDFSASLNPFGMPPAARDAARRAVDDASAYPDPHCRALAAALAAELDVPESFLFFANGAADAIHRFAQAARPGTALVTAPAFAEYERALAAVGCRTARHTLRRENNFDLDESLLPEITPELDVLFLCQPNNPTGRAVAPALLETILRRCADTGTILFMDECFCAFLDAPETHSLRRCIKDFPNLVLLDSFTKLYAIAGLRLGYTLCADAALRAKLAAAGQPWPVSTVAQAAAIAALVDKQYVTHSLAHIRAAKNTLLQKMKSLPVEVLGADANYIFFFSPAPELDDRLARTGILIRNCANFPALGAGYYRIAVRREEENEILLAALAAILHENGHP